MPLTRLESPVFLISSIDIGGVRSIRSFSKYVNSK